MTKGNAIFSIHKWKAYNWWILIDYRHPITAYKLASWETCRNIVWEKLKGLSK